LRRYFYGELEFCFVIMILQDRGILMKDFDQLLQEDITGYEGPLCELISYAPAFFCLLTGLLDDPALPGRLRPWVILAIAYFTIPADNMPVDLTGPAEDADDIFLNARRSLLIHTHFHFPCAILKKKEWPLWD
jgi:hypothetical protein